MIQSQIWCQDHNWRAYFEGKCFKSLSFLLPEKLISYLNLDTVIVDISDTEDEVQSLLKSSEFQAFLKTLSDSIQELSPNGVVPRLNWSTPK